MPRQQSNMSTTGGGFRTMLNASVLHRRGGNQPLPPPTSRFAGLAVEDDAESEDDEDDDGEYDTDAKENHQEEAQEDSGEDKPPSINTTDSGNKQHSAEDEGEQEDAEDDEDEEDEDDEGWEVAGPKHKTFNHDLKQVVYGAIRTGPTQEDWRATMGTGRTNRHSVYPTATTNNQNYRPIASQNNTIHISEITPGTLLYHRYVQRHYDDDPDQELDDKILIGSNGQPYFEKGRIWYVTSVHEEHWNEVGVFTYQNKGLAEKPKPIRNEHIGILPYHMDIADYHQQNDNEPIRIRRMKDKSEKLSENAFIRFTEQRCAHVGEYVRIIGYTHGTDVVSRLRREHGCT